MNALTKIKIKIKHTKQKICKSRNPTKPKCWCLVHQNMILEVKSTVETIAKFFLPGTTNNANLWQSKESRDLASMPVGSMRCWSSYTIRQILSKWRISFTHSWRMAGPKSRILSSSMLKTTWRT